MIKIKKVILLITTFILLTSITSCGRIFNFSADKDSSDKQINIRISWWGGDSRHQATLDAISKYEDMHPGVDIQTQFGAWDGWENKISTALYADTAPDINQINWNWIKNLSSDGSKFLDINTVSDYFDLKNYDDSILKECTQADKLQAIPVSLTGRIFYWDKTTFDEAGISVPETLDDLYKAGEIFKTKLGDDFYPLALAEYDRMVLMVYYLQSVYGKPWMEDDKLNYSKEEIQKGLEFIKSLEENHVIPDIRTITGDGAPSLDKNIKWINGKYAGIFEWDSAASKFEQALEEKREFVVGSYMADMGKYDGGSTKISLCFAISETTEYPEECARLLNFLLNEDEGTSLMGAERGIPLSNSAYKNCSQLGLFDDKAVTANQRIMQWSQFSLDSMFENAKLRENPDGVYYDVMSGLSYGDYSVEEAARILHEGITDINKK